MPANSPVLTDPTLINELASKQEALRSVYDLPENARDGTMATLRARDGKWLAVRSEGEWQYLRLASEKPPPAIEVKAGENLSVVQKGNIVTVTNTYVAPDKSNIFVASLPAGGISGRKYQLTQAVAGLSHYIYKFERTCETTASAFGSGEFYFGTGSDRGYIQANATQSAPFRTLGSGDRIILEPKDDANSAVTVNLSGTPTYIHHNGVNTLLFIPSIHSVTGTLVDGAKYEVYAMRVQDRTGGSIYESDGKQYKEIFYNVPPTAQLGTAWTKIYENTSGLTTTDTDIDLISGEKFSDWTMLEFIINARDEYSDNYQSTAYIRRSVFAQSGNQPNIGGITIPGYIHIKYIDDTHFQIDGRSTPKLYWIHGHT